jgi:wyosine [tRNA(Phe)-imidazoG37] synthetase (radical SAM superfamily)
MAMKYNHLFGPVPSRRLGLSLGVDLVPPKVCTLNCVYCECGATTRLTVQRQEYVPTSEIKAELRHFLKDTPRLDVITFSGNGEPTLHSNLGSIIDFIKTDYPGYKIAVLTNGTLLSDSQVRLELMQADILIPSLDAVRDETLQRINRPAPEITLQPLLQGLRDLRLEYNGQIWLEIFIVPGINDTRADIDEMKLLLPQLAPDRIQFNSLDRPGSESWVATADYRQLQQLASELGGEVIARKPATVRAAASGTELRQRTVDLISRRPCTVDDLTVALGASEQEIKALLKELQQTGKLSRERKQRGLFYRWQETQ